ncbi:unnamed protein product [Parnassius mnemosyne]|uniref:Reverse transcriptase domain-containing protein n=1 Tax=Parnassius mnemosyne TaxID=213953 RepID=A0AAV1KEI6_9NEOP
MESIKIYYQNVRGLRTKTLNLFRNVCLNSYDIIIFTETWLVDSIHNSELFDDRYLVWRRDRNYCSTSQTRGGGVLIAVRNDLSVVERGDWRSSAEDIWVSILLKRSRPPVTYNINICALYLCRENIGNSYNTQLLNFTQNINTIILSNPCDKFIIVGDFNFGSQVDWNVCSDSGELLPTNHSCQYISDFLDSVNTCSLSQYNCIRNINGRLLDLVFSNDLVDVKECYEPLAMPPDMHHKPLVIKADFVELHKLDDKKKNNYLFHKGDYVAISSALDQVNWYELLGNDSLDNVVTLFYNKLYELREQFIPIKSTRRSSHPPWYNSALLKVLKEKHKYHRKFKLYGNLSDYQSFSLLRKRANQLERVCFESYIDKIESSITSNPKIFWSFIKSRNNASTTPNVIYYEESSANTGEGISDLFAKYFSTTFVEPELETSNSKLFPITDYSINSISSIHVSDKGILKLLQGLDISKSGGPDHIPPIFIINCAKSLVKPISILFKRSLTEGIVPQVWKSAFITPVFKKGDKSNVGNYRPISKLCLFSKVLERIVYNEVYYAVQNYLGDEQHGFLRRRSTTSNLITANEYITKGMDQRAQVDVIYTDYSKCFDRINHRVLLQKLLASGIHGDLYRWFCSYIENRTQAVVLRGYMSGWCSIPSGVPQGSLLGPLLFTIFIADIKSCFKNSLILLYADDMKILKTIHNLTDVKQVQEDLNRFSDYCKLNKLQLNISKCSHMTFTRQRSSIGFGYTLHNQTISRVNHIHDLGVIHDNKFIFDKHIEYIVNKASKALGFILRTSSCFRSLKAVKILYCSYVRSHLEYASQVWNPQYIVYISRIESIQKKFLRYLDFKAQINSANYLERCKRYHFLPLEYRRKVNDICFLVNIVNGSIDSSELLTHIMIRTDLMRFRQRPLLYIPLASTNYRRNSFFLRSAMEFNRLSSVVDIDLFSTSSKFVKKVMNREFFTHSRD